MKKKSTSAIVICLKNLEKSNIYIYIYIVESKVTKRGRKLPKLKGALIPFFSARLRARELELMKAMSTPAEMA